MFRKRLAVSRAGWRLALCVFFVPTIFLVIALSLATVGMQTQLAALVTQQPQLGFSVAPFPASVPVFAFKAGIDDSSADVFAIASASPPDEIDRSLIVPNSSSAASLFVDHYGLIKPGADNISRTLQRMECAILDLSRRIKVGELAPPRLAVAWRGPGTSFLTRLAGSSTLTHPLVPMMLLLMRRGLTLYQQR